MTERGGPTDELLADAQDAPEPIVDAAGATDGTEGWVWLPRRLLPLIVVTLVAIPFLHYGPHPRSFIAAFLLAVLGWLAVIDLERRIIPNRIVYPSMALVLGANIAFYPGHTLEWVLAGLAAGLLMLIPQVVRADAVGMGDVKLAALLGFGLGKQVATALVLGLIATWPLALLLFARQGRAARGTPIPLGPFLTVGTILAVLIGSGAVV